MTTKHTPEAVALADAVLKAAGSGLHHYSMTKTREAILTAAQHGINKARSEQIQTLESVLKIAAIRLHHGNIEKAGALNELLRDIEGTCHAALNKAAA